MAIRFLIRHDYKLINGYVGCEFSTIVCEVPELESKLKGGSNEDHYDMSSLLGIEIIKAKY